MKVTIIATRKIPLGEHLCIYTDDPDGAISLYDYWMNFRIRRRDRI